MDHYGNVKVHGTLDMRGNAIKNMVIGEDVDSIEYAVPGRVARYEGRLLFCIDIGNGQPLWIPLLQERSAFIHTQTEASSTWTVPHNMNTTKVIVQIYNDTGLAVIPDSIEAVDIDTVQVTFATAVTGHAVVLTGNFDGALKPDMKFEQGVTNQDSITVNHNLGYEPVVRFINSAGFELLPDSVQHTTNNQVIVTFTSPVSGKVICI